MSANCIELFGKLSEPNEKDAFSAIALPDREALRLAKDSQERPALLVAVEELGDSGVPIELRNLRCDPSLPCKIQNTDGRTDIRTLAVIRCLTDDAELKLHFLRVLDVLIRDIGQRPSESDLKSLVGGFVELFQSLERPTGRTIQGLWCELFVIANANNVSAAISAWHSNPRDLFDFSKEGAALEVKSSLTGVRQHTFRLEQLVNGANGLMLIASLILSKDDRGDSVADLWDRISSSTACESAQREKVLRVIVASLGKDWRHAYRMRFDSRSAKESLRLYNASDVPKVSLPTPDGVSEVRFRVDLSNIANVPITHTRARAGLFVDLFGAW